MGFSEEMAFRDCPWCGLRDAQMAVLKRNLAADAARGVRRTYSIVGCPRCAGVVTIETNPANVPGSEERSVMPTSAEHAVPGHVPDDVRGFYLDAKRVLDVGVPDAAAVQLRRTLEAAAAHHGVTSGPLVRRIQTLISEGLITSGFAEAVDHVRQLGNIGAHASDERLTDEAVERAFRFTTQVLVNLFEIPAELAALGTPDEATPEAD